MSDATRQGTPLSRLPLPHLTAPALRALIPSRAGLQRAFWRIPVIGRMAREVVHGPRDNVWYLGAGVVSLWIMSIAAWGPVALVIPAVLAVPLLLAMLVAISMG